jgi:hypothetical protein
MHFVREEVSVSQYQMYVLDKHLFLFDSSIRYETYQNESYYGIIFFIDGEGDGLICKDARYDVVHHYHMDWERLIINTKEGWKDLPFHKGTYRFLPDQIKVLDL